MSSPDLGFSVMEKITLVIIVLLYACAGILSGLGFLVLIR